VGPMPPHEATVAARFENRVTSPPALRSSEPTPSAKRVPAWERSSRGRGSDPTRANGGAFGKLNKWRCERVKPPSAARKINDGPRGTGTAAAPRKSGAVARVMAPTPWRAYQRAGRWAGLPGSAVKWPERRARRWRVGHTPPTAGGTRRSLGTVRTPGPERCDWCGNSDFSPSSTQWRGSTRNCTESRDCSVRDA